MVVLALGTIVVLSAKSVWAQNPSPPSAQVPAGGTTTTTVTAFCPRPLVPESIAYTRDPPDCGGATSFALTFYALPDAPEGSLDIPIYDCSSDSPPACDPLGVNFALEVITAPLASPTPTVPIVTPDPVLVDLDKVPELVPSGQGQEVLNEWLERLRKAIEEKRLVAKAIDALPALREGQQHTLTFELPKKLVTDVAEAALEGEEVQTAITAKLRGKSFLETPLDSEVKGIEADAGAEWQWLIEPVGSGSAHLTLELGASATLGQDTWIEPFPSETRSLPIQANWWYKVVTFVGDSWKWFLTLVLPTALGAFITGRKTGPSSRHVRKRDSAGDAPASVAEDGDDEEASPAR